MLPFFLTIRQPASCTHSIYGTPDIDLYKTLIICLFDRKDFEGIVIIPYLAILSKGLGFRTKGGSFL